MHQLAGQALVGVGYLGLSAAATRVSWRHSMGLVGLTLCLCSAITTAAFFGTSFASRVTLELCQAGALVVAARLAFVGSQSAWCAAVMGLAVVDIAWCVVMATQGPEADLLYSIGVNALFVMMCVCVAAPGVTDAVVDTFARRRTHRAVGRAGDHRDVGGDA